MRADFSRLGRAHREQFFRREQHARRAIAALQSVALLEGILQIGDRGRKSETPSIVSTRAPVACTGAQDSRHTRRRPPHGQPRTRHARSRHGWPVRPRSRAEQIHQRLRGLDGLAYGLAVDGERNVVRGIMTSSSFTSSPGSSRDPD